MAEKRSFPRKKRRLIVDYDDALGGVHTGFTWDLSFTGLFIASPSPPRIGEILKVRIHLSEGKKLEVAGRVVRAKRVPPMFTTEHAGFSLELVGYFEEYTRYLATL
jgi:hypothetical protein